MGLSRMWKGQDQIQAGELIDDLIGCLILIFAEVIIKNRKGTSIWLYDAQNIWAIITHPSN